MGGACVGGRRSNVAVTEPLLRKEAGSAQPSKAGKGARQTSDAALQESLAKVLKAAPKGTKACDAILEQTLSALSEAGEPEEVGAWLSNWHASAPAKTQAGLTALLRRAVDHAVESSIVVAEELLQEAQQDAVDLPELGRSMELCRPALTLERTQRRGVLAASLALSSRAASSAGLVDADLTQFVVQSFDKLVLLFRPAFMADVSRAPEHLQLWRELLHDAGLPPIHEHFGLLSCGAKAVLISLVLLPSGAPPAAVVLRREAATHDLAEQLPEGRACLVSPYFEAPAGTKMVRGRRVEGGEGHGPRKEFFVATSSAACEKWGAAVVAPTNSTSASSSASGVPATCRGVCLKLQPAVATDEVGSEEQAAVEEIQKLLHEAQRGDKLTLQLHLGQSLERIVTMPSGPQGICVDRPFAGEVQDDAVLISRCSVQQSISPLFSFHRSSGSQWFSSYADGLAGRGAQGEALRLRYRVFGKLLALALANRCKIAFTLPALFFHFLLNREAVPVLDNLRGFDNDLYASLKKCLTMRDAAFASVREVEGLGPEATKDDYVKAQVMSTMTPDGMAEVRQGFWALLGEASALRGLSGKDVQQLLCPAEAREEKMDLRRIFMVCMEEEMSSCPGFVNAFWDVVDSFSLQEKKQFLRFVTGVDAPPEPGTERLIIQLPFAAFTTEEHASMLGMLPQAHTCSNTIELPNYYEALRESGTMSEDASEDVLDKELHRILGERLRLAMQETSGYELDAVDGERLAGGVDAIVMEAEQEVRLAAGLGEGQQNRVTMAKTPSRPTSSPRPPSTGALGGPDTQTSPPPPQAPPPASSEAVSPLALIRATGWNRDFSQEWQWNKLEKKDETLGAHHQEEVHQVERSKSNAARKTVEESPSSQVQTIPVAGDTITPRRQSVDSLLEELEEDLKDHARRQQTAEDGWSPATTIR